MTPKTEYRLVIGALIVSGILFTYAMFKCDGTFVTYSFGKAFITECVK